jgi:hypothetical protein
MAAVFTSDGLRRIVDVDDADMTNSYDACGPNRR